MINFYDYSNVFNTLDENRKIISYSSISYTPKIPLKRFLLKTKILQVEKYRPDKISYRLFNDPRLSWILDEINNFYSFSDYYPEREIYYLDEKGLSFIGIETDYVPFDYDNF